ncbi:MAG: hypothetical protein ACR2PK_10215, partial [Acidimicrobiales bacterium]
YSGIFGGSRKWLLIGGLAWVYHWLDRLITGGDPTPRYTRDLGAGERVFVIHEPVSPREVKMQAKKAAKEERRAAKDQRKAAKRAS